MFTHRARRIVLALAGIVPPTVAAAQVVVPGARVRVVDASSTNPLVTGTLVRLAGDSVTILTAANLAAAAAHSVWALSGQRHLEVRTAVHDQQLLGAVFGGLSGAAAGYLIGSRTANTCGQSFGPCYPPATLGAFAGALVGAAVGAIAGHGMKTETWLPADRSTVRVASAPGSRSVPFAVVPGVRVRIVDVSSNRLLIVGELVRLTGDSAAISTTANRASASTPVVWAVGAQHRLEVRTGLRRKTMLGMYAGMTAGMLAGYAVGPRPRGNCSSNPALCVGMLGGALAGGFLGHRITSATWSRVNHCLACVTIVPDSRGVRLAASIAF